MAKAKKGMIELPNASFQSQTKAGIAVDFDMLAFLGLTYGVMTLGPKDSVDVVLGFWSDAFGTIAEGFGSTLAGGGQAFTDGLKAIFGL